MFTLPKPDQITPNDVYWLVIIFITIPYAWKLYLCIRQRRMYKRSTEVPNKLRKVLNQEIFEKSRQYGLEKNALNIFSEIYFLFILLGILHFGGMYRVWKLSKFMLAALTSTWDPEVGVNICVYIICSTIEAFIRASLHIYKIFVIEEKYGFNRQTLWSCFKYDLKYFSLVSNICISLLLAACVKLIQIAGGIWPFWITIFGFLFCKMVFNDSTPKGTYRVGAGPLKNGLETLADLGNIPTDRFYVQRESDMSTHLNAYITATLSTPTITFFDTMFKSLPLNIPEGKGCRENEIIGIAAHEVGHWKLNHFMKTWIMVFAEVIFVLLVFSILYQIPKLYHAFGFPQNDNSYPILVGFLIIEKYVLPMSDLVHGYLKNTFARSFEYDADKFAAKLGYGKFLKKALVTCLKHNLTFPFADPFHAALNDEHPTILQRISVIDAELEWKKKVAEVQQSFARPGYYSLKL